MWGLFKSDANKFIHNSALSADLPREGKTEHNALLKIILNLLGRIENTVQLPQ